MEEKRPGATATSAATANTSRRESGIPKLSSRLPLPRSVIPTPTSSSSTVRPQQKSSISKSETPRASVSSTVGSLRNPRLRATQSREQIKPSGTLPRSTRPAQPPVSSQSTLKDLNNRNRTSLSDGQHRPLHSQPDSASSPFKKPLVPRRRPSSQFSYGAQSSSATLVEDVQSAYTTEDKTEDDQPELPPLTKSAAAENLTFDTLLAESRKPRPSLSERTIETLSNLPSSPAVRRRGSNFFDASGSGRPRSKGSVGSRPESSYQSDRSDGRTSRPSSRPGSSSGSLSRGYGNFRASTNSYKPPLATVQGTPSRRISAYGSNTTTPTKTIPKLAPRPTLNKVSSRASLSASLGPRPTSPEKGPTISVSKYGSKTLAARPVKPRGSVNGLFKKPSMPALNTELATSELSPAKVRNGSLASARSSRTSGEGPNMSSPSTSSTAPTVNSVEEAPLSARKSSAALRDQIAKAKAAKRAANRQASSTLASEPLKSPVIPTDDTFDFGLSDDPFGQKSFEQSNRKVMQSRIDTARTTGRLNIAAMGLKEIPEQVLKMYDLESVGRADGSWGESVDVTRFVAADNELETIDDSIFPDVDPNGFDTDEVDDRGRIFWGLESADLHNNTLISLPLGLRRLQLLTSLNLVGLKKSTFN